MLMYHCIDDMFIIWNVYWHCLMMRQSGVAYEQADHDEWPGSVAMMVEYYRC